MGRFGYYVRSYTSLTFCVQIRFLTQGSAKDLRLD